MLQVGRLPGIAALCVFVALVPGLAAAQETASGSLRIPTIAAGAAAAADWTTTYYALKNFRLREVNPVLSPMQHEPARMISVGAAMDVGLTVCQSGMALVGMTASELVPQVRAGGLVSLLAAATPDDQLIVY